MNSKFALIFSVGLVLSLSACTGSNTAGYGPVRIETYPLDGSCELKGHGYTMKARAPSDLVVPLSAAPIVVSCSTKSGYKGTETLTSTYDPWSPANVGSLGVGFLLDKSTGSGHSFPKSLQVTMIYTEAGKPKDTRDEKQSATGAEISKQGVSITDNTAVKRPDAKQDKPVMTATVEGLPRPPTKKNAEMPAPKAMTSKPKAAVAAQPAPIAKAFAPTATIPLFPMDVRIHLASFKKRENAERTWQKLSLTHPDLLKDLSALIKVVDIPKKGKFHRVYAGPMTNLAAAQALCKSFKSRKVYCRPVASGAK